MKWLALIGAVALAGCGMERQPQFLVDPKTGCRFLVVRTVKGVSAVQIMRADGKPDCRR